MWFKLELFREPHLPLPATEKATIESKAVQHEMKMIPIQPPVK